MSEHVRKTILLVSSLMIKDIQKFSSYSKFIDYMENVVSEFLTGQRDFNADKQEMEILLNGANAKAVSKFLLNALRKDKGIFFTNEVLASKVAERIKQELTAGCTVFDPACGAGDLLLACSKYMPVKETLAKTLRYWSYRIYGQDLLEDFVRSAQSRLILSALYQFGANTSSVKSKVGYFSQISVCDFFEHTDFIRKSDCIVTNPPFGHVNVHKKVDWSSGRTQLAALFMDHLIKVSRNGQKVVAVLPDVLRSGSRYTKWRSLINSNTESLNFEVCGRFNAEADVDVFILDFVVKKYGVDNNNGLFRTEHSLATSETSIGNYFNISVGPVVPHRDKQDGNQVPYLDVAGAELWKEIHVETQCRYNCTLKKPPFVVVRRTSSPSDNTRLKASLIRGNEGVAVENHLIVLKPKDGTVRACKKFLKIAKSSDATEWLNERIRCRHLTVSSIKEMPCFGMPL